MERSTGDIIRYWRKHRGLSQMALAEELDISFRHMNYVENDKSQGSRELLLKLGEALCLSLRARNALLKSAGYAPQYSHTNLSSSENQQAEEVLSAILKAAEPNPAMLIDKHLNVLRCNRSMELVIDTFAGNPQRLRAQALTIPRLNFDPDGLWPSLVNKSAAVSGIMGRLHHAMESAQFDYEDISHYQALMALVEQAKPQDFNPEDTKTPHLVVPFELRRGQHHITLYTVITCLGAPHDISLQEMQIDAGFPADDQTRAFFAQIKSP